MFDRILITPLTIYAKKIPLQIFSRNFLEILKGVIFEAPHKKKPITI